MGEHKTYRRLSKEKNLVRIHILNIMHYTHMFHTEYCIVISSDILLYARDYFSYIDTAKKFTSR